MGFVLGINGKLYRNTALLTSTTWSATGWDLIPNVKDVATPIDTTEADTTTRANNGWEATVPVLNRAEITFEMVYDKADPDYKALRDAFLGRTEIALAILDDLVAGTPEGLVSNFTVTKFGRVENANDVMRVPIAIKPSSFTFWKAIP